MQDPFPIQPIPWLQDAVQPVAGLFGFQTLPLHIHEVLAGCLLYGFIYYPLAPVLSAVLFPQAYPQLPHRRKVSWHAHCVSLFQSCMINVVALWVMFVDDERKAMGQEERIWGYSGASGMVQGLAAGYFLWDLIVTARNMDVFGLGTLAHAVSALLVYSLGFVSSLRPSGSPSLPCHLAPQPAVLWIHVLTHFVAALRELLCVQLYSLGTLDSVPQHTLVPGQTREDGLFDPAVQWPDPDHDLLLMPSCLRNLPILPHLPRYMAHCRWWPSSVTLGLRG